MNRLYHIWPCGAVALFLIFSVTASGQWDKKPSAAWSEKEAQKLLDNSPWAKSSQYAFPRRKPKPSPGSNGSSGIGNDEKLEMQDSQVLKFHMRLISAKPMIEALNRSNLIRENREQTLAHIKALNANNDHIVISVSCDYNQFSLDKTDHRPKTPEEVKRKTFLEVKGGGRIYLQDYEPSSEDRLGWILIFPRLVDGKPLITPESGEVHFHTEVYFREIYRFVQPTASYKAKEMVYESKLEY